MMGNAVTLNEHADELALSVSTSDADDFAGKLRKFLGIDDQSKQYARVLSALFATHSDDIVSDFYRQVQQSEIGSYITDAAIERLKHKQKAHWSALFSSDFGRDYAQSVRRIGIRHRDVSLNPSWYVAGYAKLKIEMMRRIGELDTSADTKLGLAMALEKYVAIDMALSMASYDSVILD